MFSELFYLRHFYISFKVFLKFWFVLVFWHNFLVFETFEDIIINITLILNIILFTFLDLRPPNMIFWMFRIVGLGCFRVIFVLLKFLKMLFLIFSNFIAYFQIFFFIWGLLTWPFDCFNFEVVGVFRVIKCLTFHS